MTNAIFSESELRILDILGSKQMTIIEISDTIHGADKPMNADVVVASTVRRIIKKCRLFKTTWTLTGKGAGRAGRTIWKETQKPRGRPRR